MRATYYRRAGSLQTHKTFYKSESCSLQKSKHAQRSPFNYPMHELVSSDAGLVSIQERDTTLFKEGRETALKLSWLIWEEVKGSLDPHQYTNLHTCVHVPTKIARKTFVTQKQQSLRLHQRCCTNCEQAWLKKTHQELRTGLWRVCSQGTNSSHNEDFSLCIAGRESFGHQQPLCTGHLKAQKPAFVTAILHSFCASRQLSKRVYGILQLVFQNKTLTLASNWEPFLITTATASSQRWAHVLAAAEVLVGHQSLYCCLRCFTLVWMVTSSVM